MQILERLPSDEKEFDDIHFKNIDLSKQILESYEFHDCLFSQCQLQESQFRNSKVVDCKFEACDLSLIKLTGSTIREVSFNECKLIGINWCAATAVQFLDFQQSIINYNIFLNMDLRHLKLVNTSAHEADFSEANLSEAICSGTDFKGSNFINSNLTKADFRGALNYNINSEICRLKQTKFALPEALALLKGLDIILE